MDPVYSRSNSVCSEVCSITRQIPNEEYLQPNTSIMNYPHPDELNSMLNSSKNEPQQMYSTFSQHHNQSNKSFLNVNTAENHTFSRNYNPYLHAGPYQSQISQMQNYNDQTFQYSNPQQYSGYHNQGFNPAMFAPQPPMMRDKYDSTRNYPNYTFNEQFHNMKKPNDPNEFLSKSYNGFPNNQSMMYDNMNFINNMNNVNTGDLNTFLASYRQWFYQVNKIMRLKNNPKERLTPYKFMKKHSKVSFGFANQLITVSGSCVIIHEIKPYLIEKGEQTLINTWPGPLEKKKSDKKEILEFVNGQERLNVNTLAIEQYYLNNEKKQLWQLLSIMVKQNGTVSSSELAQFLINNNEAEFETEDMNTELGAFRRFLLLGQKKTALDFAQKSKLWGHTFTLAYLISKPEFNESMINTINDFTDSTLNKDDPIFSLYRCLLLQIKKYYQRNNVGNMVPPSSLQQFTILLANDCEVSPVIAGSAFVSEVLKLIVALRDSVLHFINLKNSENYFLKNMIKPDHEAYSEEILFMNETFEYAFEKNIPLLGIIPFKTIFATKLFDYGLIDQCKKYCEVIRNNFNDYNRCGYNGNLNDLEINWDLVIYIIDSLENRIEKNENFPSLYTSEQSSTNSNSSEIQSTPFHEEDYVNSNSNNVQPVDEIINEPQYNFNEKQKNGPLINKDQPSAFTKPPFKGNIFQKKPLPIDAEQTIEKLTALSKLEIKETTNQKPIKDETNIPQSQVDGLNFNFKPISKVDNIPTKTTSAPLNFFVPQPLPMDSGYVPNFVSRSEVIEPAQNDENSEQIKNNFNINETAFEKNLQLPPRIETLNSTVNNQPNQNYIISPAMSPIINNLQTPNLDSEPKRITNNETNQFKNDLQNKDILATQNQNQKNFALNDKSKGFIPAINNWISKIRPKTNEAILPDDLEQRFYFDKELQKWIDLNENLEEVDSVQEMIKQGPPKIPLISNIDNLNPPSSFQNPIPNSENSLSGNIPTFPPTLNPNQLSFMRSKQKRYVDVLQQK